MQKILAISGKKNSGKTTSSNFIFGLEMLSIQEPRLIDWFKIDNEGKLVVPANFDGEIREGIFDPVIYNQNTQEFLFEHIWPYIKIYNFADPLKQGICMNLLGLSVNQCYGTNKEKDSLTNFDWTSLPWIIDEDLLNATTIKYVKKLGLRTSKKSKMSTRQILQEIGSNFFRKFCPGIWVDTTIRRILGEGTQFALIADCRFPDEVEGIQQAGGRVIRFTRNQESKDTHESETALDPENFDWAKFDKVIDNSNMSISEQNQAVYDTLKEWGWLDYQLEEINQESYQLA